MHKQNCEHNFKNFIDSAWTALIVYSFFFGISLFLKFLLYFPHLKNEKHFEHVVVSPILQFYHYYLTLRYCKYTKILHVHLRVKQKIWCTKNIILCIKCMFLVFLLRIHIVFIFKLKLPFFLVNIFMFYFVFHFLSTLSCKLVVLLWIDCFRLYIL